jgi:hypothetical protein
MNKEYQLGTIQSILEGRLADLLDHKTIDREMFVPLVMSDIKQDLPQIVNRGIDHDGR